MPIYVTGRKKKRSLLMPILLLFAFLGAITLAVLATKNIVTRELSEIQTVQPISQADQSKDKLPAPTEERAGFSADTVMEISYSYACGHTESRMELIPEAWVGKTQKEAEAEFPEYQITSASPLTVNQKKRSLCDQHYLLRLEGERLVVRLCNDTEKIVKEMEIDINLLPFESIEILNKGIQVDGETALLEFLEDFAS